MLRSLFRIPTRDKTKAIQSIIEDSALKPEQIVLNVIAVCIAVLGVYQNSIPLIIASMIIAPLILPIIGIALGITLRNLKLILSSLRNLWVNTACIFVAWALITLWLRLIGEFSTEWYLWNETFYYVTGLTGIFAGIASAFMLSNEKLNNSMAGIAIAVALVPPLAVSTIQLSLFNQTEFLESFGAYITNIITIIIWCVWVFYLMNFKMRKEKVDDKVEEEEKKNEW